MSFDNCTEAYAAGYSHIPASSPNYAAKLDRDNDGIGCDDPPAGFQPVGEVKTGTKPGVGVGDELPLTGPAMEIGIAGSLMLAIGIVATVLVRRRRRTRFSA